MNLRLSADGYALKVDIEELAILKDGHALSMPVSSNPALTVTIDRTANTSFDILPEKLTIGLTAQDIDDLEALGSNRDGILLQDEGWQLRLQIDIRSQRSTSRAQMPGGRDKGLGFRRSAGGVSPTAPRSRR